MRKRNRIYTESFRRQAVELAEQLGSPAEAARQLGIDNANIYTWRMRKKSKQNEKNSSAGAETEAEELKRLRKENNELRKVNHILKAAAAFFSQDHLK